MQLVRSLQKKTVGPAIEACCVIIVFRQSKKHGCLQSLLFLKVAPKCHGETEEGKCRDAAGVVVSLRYSFNLQTDTGYFRLLPTQHENSNRSVRSMLAVLSPSRKSVKCSAQGVVLAFTENGRDTPMGFISALEVSI